MAWRGTNGGNPITGKKPIVNHPVAGPKNPSPSPGKPTSSLGILK